MTSKETCKFRTNRSRVAFTMPLCSPCELNTHSKINVSSCELCRDHCPIIIIILCVSDHHVAESPLRQRQRMPCRISAPWLLLLWWWQSKWAGLALQGSFNYQLKPIFELCEGEKMWKIIKSYCNMWLMRELLGVLALTHESVGSKIQKQILQSIIIFHLLDIQY